MQRRESSRNGPAKAPVGHASRQRVQLPQLTLDCCPSSGSSALISSSDRKCHDPPLGCNTLVFFPKNPIPARCAIALSSNGTASTKQRYLNASGVSLELAIICSILPASLTSRGLTTS